MTNSFNKARRMRAVSAYPGMRNALFVSMLALGAVSAPVSVAAAEITSPVSYDIPSGALDRVLSRFATSTGMTLQFNPSLTQGLQSAGLQGSYSPEQGLDQLLSGTGLMATRRAPGVYILEKIAAGDEMVMGPIRIGAESLASTQDGIGAVTEGTGSYKTEAMGTATRLSLSEKETPQSVTVVSRQLIDDMGLETITDVVNHVPGVTARSYDGRGAGFSARGFDIDNLQVDGVPTTWTAGWSAGETRANTQLYDRVEVVRGASGLVSGAGNPAAAINLVRKRANSKEFTGKTSISGSRWDTYSGSFDVSGGLNETGSLRGRVVGSFQQGDSFMDLASDEETLFLGTIGADLTPNTEFNAGISYQQNKPEGSAWGGLPTWFSDGSKTDWDRSKTTAADWSEWSSENTNYYANLEHRFDSGVRLYGALSRSVSDADLRLIYLYGSPDKATGLGMGASPSWYDVERTQDNVDLYASIPFDTGAQSHELVVGVMHSEQELTTYSRAALSLDDVGNFYDWDGSFAEPEWGEKSLNSKERTTQLGGYAVARLSLADPLKLIIGSRITDWKKEGMSVGDPIEHDGVVTPYAGLIYDINDTYSTYVSYTDIFNPQNQKDRNGNYLDPLEGKNYEAGLKASFLQDRLDASLAVYRIEQDNLAQTDDGYFVPGTTDSAYYAAQGTVSEGYEIQVTGAITDNWNLTAGWSEFSAKDANGDAVNTRHARRTASLFTTYNRDKWTLGGGINWQSESYTLATNPAGDADKIKQGAYTLVNLMGRYQFSPNLSAQLNIDNLFDEEYYSNVGFYNQLAYGEPRNAKISLTYKF
ncbi:TonB-dependent siderophore receptor [Marinobacterium lutimaris]|uniref:Outer-membrane receptor for ferric coprogen and ferric-rhodotorulic acid n=1 Tax=Marinobacterium lutimaris TaxID=568106 RepID=A0A1H6DI31_9GAMM|nr:TonB-dependent receptor [Marinobacterium lutimaris]SEG84900.1 outer-membrane receptor for ferric coprogen and ferric-rhodotorulic acid [Marinobacterium lutimaris]